MNGDEYRLVFEFDANTEELSTRQRINATNLNYIVNSSSSNAPVNYLYVQVGLLQATDFSTTPSVMFNRVTDNSKVYYGKSTVLNTGGNDYQTQGATNSETFINVDHLANKKFYVVAYVVTTNHYSNAFTLKVSYSALLNHTFSFANTNQTQLQAPIEEQKIIVNGSEKQSGFSIYGYNHAYSVGSSITIKPKTQVIGLESGYTPRKHRRWNSTTSDFNHQKQFYANIQSLTQQAEFENYYTITVNNSSIEGSTPSFTFQDPWELESDGVTQLNSPKTYSGDTTFQVFAGTNFQSQFQSSQPTYTLNKGAVTGTNGIDYFVLGESATGATFHQAQSDDETIVTFSGNATINRTYKAKNHSTVSSVVGLDNRRIVATDWASSSVFRAYESTYFGVSRIWIQYKTDSSQEWENEFLMELPQTDPLADSYLAARNPQIATSLGGLWVVYEALSAYDNQWYYVASLISNATDAINISYLHSELFTDATKSILIPAGTLLTISGDDSGSNGSTLAVGWKRLGTSAFDIAVLKHIINVKIGDDPNFHDIIHPIHYTGSQYPILSTIQYGLEIAINSGNVGITSVYNSYGQHKVYFREAAFSDSVKSPSTNKITNPGTLNWISSPV